MHYVLFKTLFLIAISEIVHGTENKRILLHDDSSLAQAYHTLADEVNAMKSEVKAMKSEANAIESKFNAMESEANAMKSEANAMKTEMTTLKSTVAKLQSHYGSGSLYVRWGRTSCPANATNLIYSGYAAGFYFGHSGGATNHLCLPTDPQWAHYEDTVSSGSKIYGVEYQFGEHHTDQGSAFFGGEHIYNDDAPCAVCQSIRPMMLMLPGRLDCYPGWTKEYSGYLVADHDNHRSASEYICLDSRPEVIAGGHRDDNGRLLFLVEGVCGSLKCPPYVEGRELTCVVCTK